MIILFMTLFIMFNRMLSGIDILQQNDNGKWLAVASAGIATYFGWICVAILANTMVMLVSKGFDGYGVAGNVISVLMLAIGAVLATLISLYSGSLMYALAAMWGYVGILYRHVVKTELNGEYIAVILTILAGLVLITCGISIALTITIPKGVKENG